MPYIPNFYDNIQLKDESQKEIPKGRSNKIIKIGLKLSWVYGNEYSEHYGYQKVEYEHENVHRNEDSHCDYRYITRLDIIPAQLINDKPASNNVDHTDSCR